MCYNSFCGPFSIAKFTVTVITRGYTRIHIPSGKRLQFAFENGPVQIVSFPSKNGGSFQFLTWRLIAWEIWLEYSWGISDIIPGTWLYGVTKGGYIQFIQVGFGIIHEN